jgi:hypothetical protein
MLPKFQTGLVACEGLGIFPADLSGSSALEVSLEARYCLDCVWPLCGLGG